MAHRGAEDCTDDHGRATSLFVRPLMIIAWPIGVPSTLTRSLPVRMGIAEVR